MLNFKVDWVTEQFWFDYCLFEMVIVKYFIFFIFKFATAKATKKCRGKKNYLNSQPLCNGKAVANNIFYFIFLIFAIA